MFSLDYQQRVLNEADSILSGDIYLLFRKVSPFELESGEPNWYKDFCSGYIYTNSHTYDCRRLNSRTGVDIKNIWELSRLQWLIVPALAWRITREKRYAEFVIHQMKSWIKNNKYAEGPNWNVSMEIGIRIVNFTMAFLYVCDYKEANVDDCKLILASLYMQMRFIKKNEENYLGQTYNHYLGGLIGLLTVSTLMMPYGESQKIYNNTVVSFEKEIQRQILIDGGDFEGTSCYHGLVG